MLRVFIFRERSQVSEKIKMVKLVTPGSLISRKKQQAVQKTSTKAGEEICLVADNNDDQDKNA
jgi:hypothetical protein